MKEATKGVSTKFTSYVKKLRGERDLTLRELSDLSGISTVQLNNIENGKNRPNTFTIAKLANALGVDYDILDTLLKETEE